MQSSAANIGHTEIKTSQAREKNIKVILEAAEDEFALGGYKGTSIRDIANRAGLPKANVHYYFNSKIDLYSAVLTRIIGLWEAVFSGLNPEDDPASALRQYITAKMHYCLAHSNASRIFSCEIIHGGHHLKEHFQHFNQWIQEKSRVIQTWIDQGKMDPIDPSHLLFTIWATTQYYVDYNPQAASVVGKKVLDDNDIQAATDHLYNLVIKGCGIKA